MCSLFDINIHKMIDEYYLKNKYEAHSLAIKDECYENPIFKFKSIKHEVYCKRILGLFCIDEDYYFDLFLKEAFKKLYNYLISEESYDYEKIMEIIDKHKVPRQEEVDMIMIVYGYASRYRRELENNDFFEWYNDLIDERFTAFGKDAGNNLLKDKKKQCRNVWLKFCSIHGFPQKSKTLDDFFRTLINNFEWIKDPENQGRMYVVPKIMQYEGMDSLFLGSCKITDDDINISIKTYLESRPTGKIPDYDDMLEHMIFSLFMVAFVKEYKKVKEYYFKHNQETVFREMENFEQMIQSLNTDIKDLTYDLLQSKSEIKKINEENERLKEKSKAEDKMLKAEVAKVRKELREEIATLENKLKKAEDDSEDNALELKRLREVLFAPMPAKGISHETAIVELNQYKKIMYVVSQDYGKPKIKGLEEQMPNLAFYEGSFPEKATAIFIDYQLISHSDYHDVITLTRRKKIPYYYIKSTGVGETILEMAETLRNKTPDNQ